MVWTTALARSQAVFRRAVVSGGGLCRPYLLASAYGAAARALGVRFALGRPASLVKSGTRVAVHIDGKVLTPTSVWVAAGAWSNSLLSQLGASAPQAAVRSQYWITETTALATGDMPIVLAADLRLYACRLQWRRHCRFCRIGRSGGQLREWRSEWRGSVPTNPLRVRRFRCAGVSCALHCGACRQNQWIAREAIADAGTDTLLSHSCRVRHIESQVSRFAGSTSPTGVSK